MAVKDIDTIMEVKNDQSQSVSDSKLSSAMQTLSTSLHDCLSVCILLVSSRQIASDARPDVHYKITVQQAKTDQAYRKKIEQNSDYINDEDFGWYPECISNKYWQAFLKIPFNTDILTEYTKQTLECKSKNYGRVTMRPPLLISFKHVTKDTGTASTTKQRTIKCAKYECLPNHTRNYVHTTGKTAWNSAGHNP